MYCTILLPIRFTLKLLNKKYHSYRMNKKSANKRLIFNKKKKHWLTSGTVVSYGVLMNAGALSLTSDTRTIIGILRFRRVERTVHEIWKDSKDVGFNKLIFICEYLVSIFVIIF